MASQANNKEKPPKKNDLKIQMDNFAKMAAYMNKNTFSSVTTLPPEENRLYIGGNLPKNKQPLWLKDSDPTDFSKPLPVTEAVEKEQYVKDTMMGVRSGSEMDKFLRCRKCGHGKIYLT